MLNRLPTMPSSFGGMGCNTWAVRANPAGLTDRQVEILGLVVVGRANAEIAAELVLLVWTVDHTCRRYCRG